MVIRYHEADDLREIARRIISKLQWNYISLEDVAFLRSFGSSSRRTIARCHALSKPMQLGLKRRAFYLIEAISERFDKMNEEERIKVMIHELMHIPKCFGGGFKHHDFVCEQNVDKIYKELLKDRSYETY